MKYYENVNSYAKNVKTFDCKYMEKYVKLLQNAKEKSAYGNLP